MADVTIIFGTGWGRAGWSEGAWDEGGINSFSVGSNIGSVTVVEGTGVTVSETGVAALFALGTYSITEGSGVTIVESGVEATHAVGTGYSVSGDVGISPTGLSASFAIGTYEVTGGIEFSVTGVEAAGTTGTETVTEGTGVTVSPTGVEGVGTIGTVSVASINVGVTGLDIGATVNYPVIWQEIVPSQTPGWLEI